MATRYHFVSVGVIEAAPERVHAALTHIERWAAAWHDCREHRVLAAGDGGGVGRREAIAMRSAVPYMLRWEQETVAAVAPRYLSWRVSGDLAGGGRWDLDGDDGSCRAHFDWQVATTQPWMDLGGPLARRLFAWNHDLVLRHGMEALASHLGTRVLYAGSESLPPR